VVLLPRPRLFGAQLIIGRNATQSIGAGSTREGWLRCWHKRWL